jgi:hypothetical protein
MTLQALLDLLHAVPESFRGFEVYVHGPENMRRPTNTLTIIPTNQFYGNGEPFIGSLESDDPLTETEESVVVLDFFSLGA